MKFEPLPQQEAMIAHMLDKPEALVFADPGLGKTAATLEVISTLITDGDIKGALIIAPLRVITMTWPDEIEKYDRFKRLRVADLRTHEGVDMWRCHACHIYLINYDQLQQFATWALKDKREIPVDMVVWDEISKAKSPSSKRIKAILPFRKHFKRHVGLTGSPAPNSLLDLFAPVRLVDGGKHLGTSFSAFRMRYFEPGYNGWKWTMREAAKENIERRIAPLTLTQRRQDWMHLPPTTVEDIDVELPPEARKAYKEMQKEFLTEIQDKEIVALNAAVKVGKLLQFTSGSVYDEERNARFLHTAKIVALRDLMGKLNVPVLVATAFIHERDRIVKAIPGAEEFREDQLDAWNRGEIPCWVADPRSIGHGLNLQHGSANIVWFSLTYSYEQYDQMNCRLIRTGQTKPTTIWRLIVPGTIDDVVAEVLRTKKNGQDALFTILQHLEKLR